MPFHVCSSTGEGFSFFNIRRQGLKTHPGAIFPPQSIIVTSFGCTLAPQCTSKRLKKLGQIGNWVSHNPRSDGLTTRNHRKSMKINEKWTSMKIHNHHAYRFPTKWLNESKWFKQINSNCVYFFDPNPLLLHHLKGYRKISPWVPCGYVVALLAWNSQD